MIARIWKGATPEGQSEQYLEYLKKTGVKECLATSGNRGVYVLRRITDARAEFVFISLWESLDAIRTFAGPEIDKAVYFPGDRDFLLEMDPGVAHYEVAVAPLPG